MKRKNSSTSTQSIQHTPGSISEPAASTYTNSNQKYGELSYYAGILEWDGWETAPLNEIDLFYFTIPTTYSLANLKSAFPNTSITEMASGKLQLAVDSASMLTIVEIRETLQTIGLSCIDVKSFKHIKRRDLTRLPKLFLKAVVEENAIYIQKLIYRKYASQVSQILESKEEVPGLSIELALELAASFDSNEGVPFSAYVAMKLPNKLVDRARTLNGRTLNDFATRLNKILDGDLASSLSPAEIAKRMGISKYTYDKRLKELSELRAIQIPASLNSENGERDNENTYLAAAISKVGSPEEAYLKEEAVREVRESFQIIANRFAIVIPAQLISNAVISHEALSVERKPMSNKELKQVEKILIGMKTAYLRYWKEMSTVEIANHLGHPTSIIRRSEIAFQAEIRKHLENR